IKLGVRAIDTRHEQAAAMMAHAYSRVTRRPGVCMGCSGPGTTNLVTGVANAFVDAAPLIAVGGSSPRVYLGMEAFQEIDRSEEHTSELQSRSDLVCRLLLEKKKKHNKLTTTCISYTQ